MADVTPQQRLTPTKHGLAVGGLALFGTGGCLMWTVVLIPLALPMALLGLVMAIGSLFVKTEPLAMPLACGSACRRWPPAICALTEIRRRDMLALIRAMRQRRLKLNTVRAPFARCLR